MFDSFTKSGIGLHSGAHTQVKVSPANPGKGRYFIRVDLPNQPEIPATVTAVNQTVLSTELVHNNANVRTVEHLLAALMGMGINDACLEIDGPEVPLLDGSAQVWVDSISQSLISGKGLIKTSESPITTPIYVHQGDAFVAALPSPELRFSYGIDFPDLPPIGNQWYSWSPHSEDFAQVIAPARTFGFADQIEQLRAAGLIKGGSLENALVCDASGWLNPPLRFSNEPVRHKILDLIGDLSLLARPLPQAHYLAYKASHGLHIQLVKKLLSLN
jgi:UDP-3-O-[3-hydroxymyristoyl] N-acetylglucosamine deacetylase